MSIWNKRVFRVTLGLGLIATGLYATIPNMLNVQSNKGIVNANTVALSSSIDGFVESESAEVGRWVGAGERLLTVVNTNQDRSFIHELHTHKGTLERRVEALSLQAEQLNILRSELKTEQHLYTQYARARLQHQVEDLEAKRDGIRATLLVAQQEHERHKSLQSNGHTSAVQVNNGHAKIIEFQAEIASIDAQIRACQTELRALDEHTYIGFNHSDAPYSSQRVDEIEILLADIAARVTEFEAQITQIERQIEVEQDRLNRTAEYEVTSPISGVLWRNYTHEGMTVPPNNELIVVANCATVFVDTVLTSRNLGVVSLGTKVSFRLQGEFEDYEGTVTQIYGPSMKTIDRTHAATLPELERSEIVVRVMIDLEELPDWKENYCYIGRQVSVKFPKLQTASLFGIWEVIGSVF